MYNNAGDALVFTAHHLHVTYPTGTEALRDVSLHLSQNELLAVLGPSGCGKSTLLRVLAGLLPTTRGTLEVTTVGHIELMFQDAALLPWRTVAQNVALPLELRGSFKNPTVDEMLDTVGLREFAHARPAELSGGMAQRAALARSLILQPQIMLLDEPFGALDAMTREQLTEQVSRLLRERQASAVIVTHSIREAIFFADRVLIMSARPGRILQEISIHLPTPRRWQMEHTPQFAALAAQVRAALG